MAAELQTDPHTLVARHLREGEATRAELRASTGMDYGQIEAALYRLLEVTDSIQMRVDGSGIEHYKWKDGTEMITQPSPRKQSAMSTNGSRFGISVGAEVRKVVESLPIGQETDTPRIFDALLKAHPQLKGRSDLSTLRTYISQAVAPLKGKLLALAHKGEGSGPHVFTRISVNEQEPLAKSSQDIDKSRTSTAIETRQPARLQPVNQDKSEDKPAPKNSEQFNSASYALPAFIADLRTERDELDLLIALLEKRMMRGGGQA